MAVKFPAGLRVLVVDDDHECLMTLEKMLHTCLYKVTKCHRAEIALSLLRENKNGYDVVISELHMPDMDGLKLLEHIRLEMDLPVIMMSVDDEISVVMKGVTHGASDYLIKPVRIDVLKNIWQHVVRKNVNQLGIDKAVPKPEVYSQGQIMDSVYKKDLNEVMIFCARAVADNDLLMAQWMMDELRQMVSVSGEPIQRLGAYMLEGLVARQASSGSSICKASRCKEPASSELLSYMHILYEVCPYFKFGHMSANGAIAEAMKDENRVHIIDFQIGQGSQWLTLIRAFAARPGGPPHIRITGIDDSMPAYAQGGLLNIVGKRLSKLAKMFKVPFEFHALANVCEVENLGITPGEALAMNFAFVLHHMPDESVSIENHRDRLLRLIKSLSPKVVTLVEQESNTNTAAFFPRFVETLNYYTAMFESIDVTLPRDHKERINVEQHCLGKEVVNIIACEGVERVERHELLAKWRSRFAMAGFTPYPLSSLVNATIKTLLKNYSDKYRLQERDGALYLGWKNRDLVASCAWKFKPGTKLRFAEGQQHHSNGKPMNLVHGIPTTMEAKQLANLHRSAQSLGAMNMQVNPHGVQNSSPYMPQLRGQIMNESIGGYPSYDTFNELPQQKSNDWNFFFY